MTKNFTELFQRKRSLIGLGKLSLITFKSLPNIKHLDSDFKGRKLKYWLNLQVVNLLMPFVTLMLQSSMTNLLAMFFVGSRATKNLLLYNWKSSSTIKIHLNIDWDCLGQKRCLIITVEIGWTEMLKISFWRFQFLDSSSSTSVTRKNDALTEQHDLELKTRQRKILRSWFLKSSWYKLIFD